MHINSFSTKSLFAYFCIAAAPLYLNGLTTPHLIDKQIWFWAQDITAFIIIPSILFFYLSKKGLEWKELGITQSIDNDNRPETLIWNIILWSILLTILNRLSMNICRNLFPATTITIRQHFSYSIFLSTDNLLRPIQIFYFSLSAAVTEELLFRSMLHKILYTPSSALKYIAYSSLLFALIHFEFGMASMLAAFIWGIAASIIYTNTRNIIPIITAHFITNIVSLY